MESSGIHISKITKSISSQISNDPAKTRKRERMKEGEMAKKGKILGIENFKYAVLILQEEDKLGKTLSGRNRKNYVK